MRFDPPTISHIDDVLPYIKDNPAFVVKEKGWYTVIDYVYNSPDSFENAYQRECRGLKFCSTTGRLIARPYHKFFNLEEREETKQYNLSFSEPHSILEKLDGSMIHTCQSDSGLHLMTRMGVTDVANMAAEYVRKDQYLSDNIEALQRQYSNCTLIFEYVGPRNRIVCYYDSEEMILTGIRTNLTGHYVVHKRLLEIGKEYGIPVVKRAYVDFDKETIASDPYNEGVVLRFETGAMVKVKADAYVRKHRFKDQCSSNKGLISLFVHNELDDMIGNLDGKLQGKVKAYIANLDIGIKSVVEYLTKTVNEADEAFLDRKQFALSIRTVNPILKALLFLVHSGNNPSQVVLEAFKKNCTSNTRLSALMAALEIEEWKGDFFASE